MVLVLSLITVTTIGAHGIDPVVIPITIKALENKYPKGQVEQKVSLFPYSCPQIIHLRLLTQSWYSKWTSTNGMFYTQLREAGFYTGAAIGAPTFTIALVQQVYFINH